MVTFRVQNALTKAVNQTRQQIILQMITEVIINLAFQGAEQILHSHLQKTCGRNHLLMFQYSSQTMSKCLKITYIAMIVVRSVTTKSVYFGVNSLITET